MSLIELNAPSSATNAATIHVESIYILDAYSSGCGAAIIVLFSSSWELVIILLTICKKITRALPKEIYPVVGGGHSLAFVFDYG
jgi:hypothetical protein